MSIHVSRCDSKTYKISKPARNRAEARFEVKESKEINHINTNTPNQVEPAETQTTAKTTYTKTSEKTVELTNACSHVASARIHHRSKGHISSTVHYVGKPKNRQISKNSNDRLVSSNTLIGNEKYAMADRSEIPGIPEHIRADQSSQKIQRNAIQLIPASTKPPQREKNNNIRVSLSSRVQSVRTETGSKIIVSSQATCKQPQRLRVKGQSGSKIQRNADTEPSVSLSDAQSELKSRTEHENTERGDPSSQPQQTNQHSKLVVRTQGQKSHNISTECLTLGMSHLDKQEQFTRQTHRKHSSHGSTSETSCTFTDSASDQLELSSSSDGEICSPGLSRANVSNTKRRKRVKRKGLSKSIDSYGEDNTTDGESATDTRVHERRSRKREDESSLNSSTRQASRSKPSLSGTATNTIKGAQFRSSSLTSVSSVEGGKLASAISSPLLTPRGPTLVKKIQIQSFSSSYTGFKKDNKENVPKRRASSEERFSARIRERSLVPDHPRSSKNNLERKDNGTATPLSKGRPFSLRTKPFQLKRTSSRESPCTSETESGTPYSPRTNSDNDSFVIPVEKTSNNTPSEPSSLPGNNLSSDIAFPSLDDELFSKGLNVSNQESHMEDLPVFKSDIEDTPVTLMETIRTSMISDAASTQSSRWMDQNYTTYDDDDNTFSPYGYKSLSIVNESDEIDFTQPQSSSEQLHSTRSAKTSNTNKTFTSTSDKWNLSTLEAENDNGKRANGFDPPPVSPVRRPSYIKAQQNFDDFTQSLFHSFDDQSIKPPLMETTLSGTEDDEFTEEYDPKEVLRSFSGSNIAAADALAAAQIGGDLITFDEEVSSIDATGEPVVKKRKKKIARPKIPTIFNVEGKEIAEGLSEEEDKGYPAARTRQETMGQDSMDEKCDTISLSKEGNLTLSVLTILMAISYTCISNE